MRYTVQAMEDYAANWELMSAQFVPMNPLIDEKLAVTRFVESLGDWSASPFGRPSWHCRQEMNLPGSWLPFVCYKSLRHRKVQGWWGK